MPGFTLLTLLGILSFGMAGYVLEDDYKSDTFFSMFDFFTDDDPTHGYVNYVDQKTAETQGLIGERDGSVYVGVDHKDIAQGRGRNSVRLSSKKSYNYGLIVLDLKHMPGGQCGSWPAFWMLGPDWPNGGEIDIIEGVNSQMSNDHTLHTSRGCTVHDTGAFSGNLRTADCDVSALGQSTNAGCKIVSNDTATYGHEFGLKEGGVYATEWSSDAISVWFFPRNAIPDDLSSNKPDPTGWGKPNAKFEGGCDINKHLRDHNLIFDVTFCGDWAGSVWGQDSICSSQAPSCREFVQNNPSAFEDTNWQINSLQVYQLNHSKEQAAGEAAPAESEGNNVNVPDAEEVAPMEEHESNPDLSAIEEAAPMKGQESKPDIPAVEETAGMEPLETEAAGPLEAPSEPAVVVAEKTMTLQGVWNLRVPAPTPAPKPSTLVVSVQKSRQQTVSALQWARFGSSAQKHSKNKRHRHAQRLPKTPHKTHA